MLICERYRKKAIDAKILELRRIFSNEVVEAVTAHLNSLDWRGCIGRGAAGHNGSANQLDP